MIASLNVQANSCYALPSYIVEARIINCRLLPNKKSDEDLHSVLVTVEVLNELSFVSGTPIPWQQLVAEEPSTLNHPLKGEKVALIFEDNEYSCWSAKISKKLEHTIPFYVKRLCCGLGSPWCPQSIHKAWQLPDYKTLRQSPDSFDTKHDFDEDDGLEIND